MNVAEIKFKATQSRDCSYLLITADTPDGYWDHWAEFIASGTYEGAPMRLLATYRSGVMGANDAEYIRGRIWPGLGSAEVITAVRAAKVIAEFSGIEVVMNASVTVTYGSKSVTFELSGTELSEVGVDRRRYLSNASRGFIADKVERALKDLTR